MTSCETAAMKVDPLPLIAVLMPALLGIVACGGPSRHETLVKNGRDAEAQEQWVQAAAIYQEACDAKPSDTATCTRAVQMREYAVDLRAYNAQRSCEAGRLEECLNTLAPVREFQTKNRSKVLAVLTQAAALSQKQCLATAQARQEIVPALAELRCLMGNRAPLWEVAAFRAHYGERSRAIAEQLLQRAALAKPDALGTWLGYYEAAACLAPLTGAQQARHQQVQGLFLSHARTKVDLEYTTSGTTRPAPGTCLDLANKIGRGLRCDELQASAHPALDISAEVFSLQPRWQRTYEDHRETVRYKSGTETRANPAYERARVEYELADGRLRDAERVTRDREARCLETKDESDCNAFEAAEDTSDDRLRELNQARQSFHSEPATITEDVFKDHSYVVRDHRWAAPFRATLRVGAETAATEITEVVYTDAEQPGFPEAGVREDRFQAPGDTYFRDESSRWLTSRIEARMLGELSRRAHTLVDTCQGDRVHCWALASYWLGITEFGLPLLQQISVDEALPALECSGSLL